LLSAGTRAGAAVGFAHGYLLAPLATAAILLDALSLAERGSPTSAFLNGCTRSSH